MTQWLEVDSWLDLVANAWIGLVLIAVAVVPSVYGARNHKGIQEVRQQVTNGHGDAPPLRADIDRLLVAVEALREATEDERRTRRDQIRELREDIDARLSALHKRLADG